MLIFKREPAFWISFVQAALLSLVGFGLPLSETQQTLIMALVGAVFALIVGYAVRPLQIGIFTNVVTAGFALVLGFGVHIPMQYQTSVLGLLTMAFAFYTRANVVPSKGLDTANTHPIVEGEFTDRSNVGIA